MNQLSYSPTWFLRHSQENPATLSQLEDHIQSLRAELARSGHQLEASSLPQRSPSLIKSPTWWRSLQERTPTSSASMTPPDSSELLSSATKAAQHTGADRQSLLNALWSSGNSPAPTNILSEEFITYLTPYFKRTSVAEFALARPEVYFRWLFEQGPERKPREWQILHNAGEQFIKDGHSLSELIDPKSWERFLMFTSQPSLQSLSASAPSHWLVEGHDYVMKAGISDELSKLTRQTHQSLVLLDDFRKLSLSQLNSDDLSARNLPWHFMDASGGEYSWKKLRTFRHKARQALTQLTNQSPHAVAGALDAFDGSTTQTTFQQALSKRGHIYSDDFVKFVTTKVLSAYPSLSDPSELVEQILTRSSMVMEGDEAITPLTHLLDTPKNITPENIAHGGINISPVSSSLNSPSLHLAELGSDYLSKNHNLSDLIEPRYLREFEVFTQSHSLNAVLSEAPISILEQIHLFTRYRGVSDEAYWAMKYVLRQSLSVQWSLANVARHSQRLKHFLGRQDIYLLQKALRLHNGLRALAKKPVIIATTAIAIGSGLTAAGLQFLNSLPSSRGTVAPGTGDELAQNNESTPSSPYPLIASAQEMLATLAGAILSESELQGELLACLPQGVLNESPKEMIHSDAGSWRGYIGSTSPGSMHYFDGSPCLSLNHDS